jgi:hypothetical protein
LGVAQAESVPSITRHSNQRLVHVSVNWIGTDAPLVIEAPLAGEVMLMQAACAGAEHASTTISMASSRKTLTAAQTNDTDVPAKTPETNFLINSHCRNISRAPLGRAEVEEMRGRLGRCGLSAAAVPSWIALKSRMTMRMHRTDVAS